MLAIATYSTAVFLWSCIIIKDLIIMTTQQAESLAAWIHDTYSITGPRAR